MVLKDIAKRTVVSTISIAAVICLITFAYNSWFQFVVAFAVAAMTGIAIWEYEQFAKAKGGRMILPALLVIGIAQTLSIFVSVRWLSSHALPAIVFLIGFLILIALHFKEKDGAIVDLAVSLFGLIYIAIPMGLILGILYNQAGGQDGRLWVAYLLVVTKISDMGAYFGGSFWGRRKLAPHISPGKTVEGAAVGLLCAVLASFVFFLISKGASHFQLGSLAWLVLGLLLGCIGQFGDLSESLLKRDANKKDSNALPGVGGVLDMIDSLLFNAFIVFFYLNYYLAS